MRTKHHAFVGLVVCLLVLGASARSEATLITYVCNDAACGGGDDVLLTDNGSGDVLNTIDGAIFAIITSFAGWELISFTASATPLLPPGAATTFNLSYLLLNFGGGADDIWFFVSDAELGSAVLSVNIPGTTEFGSFADTLSLSAIPEPVSALLLGLGLVCGGAIVRRRRRAA